MGLKKSKGNMYDWVTHTHAHLGGECPHRCSYCYVDNPHSGRPKRYTGDLCLVEEEFSVSYGSGKTVFIENCNDLFAKEVPDAFIHRILSHCNTWPLNTFVFQTKNPDRYLEWSDLFPHGSVLGTTIETNRETSGKAPKTTERAKSMLFLPKKFKRFVTIEPIMDFDVDILAWWIIDIKPDFLNIGADSKNKGLIEPTKEKILAFVETLRKGGVEVREKHNLSRILGD